MTPEKARSYLKSWGFGIPKKAKTESAFLEEYVKEFSPQSPNLLMLGTPSIVHTSLVLVIYGLIMSGKLKHKVKLVDVPEICIKLPHLPFSEKQEMIQSLLNENSSSDLTVFQSLELSKLENQPKNLVYSLVKERYFAPAPFISTVYSSNKLTVAQMEKLLIGNLGTGLTFLISDGAKLIQMWNK